MALVTDPELLKKLNATTGDMSPPAAPGGGPVTDPDLLAKLNGEAPPSASHPLQQFTATPTILFPKQSGDRQSVLGIASPSDKQAATGLRQFVQNDIPTVAATAGARVGAGFQKAVGGMRQAIGEESAGQNYDPGPWVSSEDLPAAKAQMEQRRQANITGGKEQAAEGRMVSETVNQEKPLQTRAGKILGMTAESIGSNLPGMALATIGLPGLGLSSMGLQTFGQAYDEARANGLDIADATNSAAIQGGTEVATELLPFVKLAKILKPGKLSSKLMSYYLAEVPGEHVATAVQNATGKYYERPGMTDAQRKRAALDYLASGEHGQDQIDTFFTTLLQTFVMGGAARLARGARTETGDAITDGVNIAPPTTPPGVNPARVDRLASIMAAETPETAAARLAARQNPAAVTPEPEAPVNWADYGVEFDEQGNPIEGGDLSGQKRETGIEGQTNANEGRQEGLLNGEAGRPVTDPATGQAEPTPVTVPAILAQLNSEPAPLEFTSNNVPVDENRLNFEIGLVKNKKTSKTAVLLPPETTPQQAKQIAKNAGMKAIRQGEELYLFDPAQIPESTLRGQIKAGKNGLALGYGTETVPENGVPYAVDLDGHGTLDPQEILSLRDTGRLGFSGMAPDMESAVAKIREMGRDDANVRVAMAPAPPSVEPASPAPLAPPPAVQGNIQLRGDGNVQNIQTAIPEVSPVRQDMQMPRELSVVQRESAIQQPETAEIGRGTTEGGDDNAIGRVNPVNQEPAGGAFSGATSGGVSVPVPMAPKPKPAPKPRAKGPRNLLTDIRQAGGINLQSLITNLDRNEIYGAKGGNRYLRVTGKNGVGLDQMATQMRDQGWQVPLDVDGRVDTGRFGDMIRGAVNGEHPTHPDDVDRITSAYPEISPEEAEEVLQAVDDEVEKTVTSEEDLENALAFFDQFIDENSSEDTAEEAAEVPEGDEGAVSAEGRGETGGDGVPSLDEFERMLDEAATPAPTKFEKTEAGDQGVLVTGQRAFGKTAAKTGGKSVGTSDLLDGFTPEPPGQFDSKPVSMQDHIGKAIDAGADAINEIFKGITDPNKLGSGPEFDDEAYQKINGAGAIRGFHFDTAEKRDAFAAALEGGKVEEPGVKYYHGSPHTFDKFSLDKIGTGEGAQAYGYGLYFAGAKEVADFYKRNLTQNQRSFDPQLVDAKSGLRDALAEVDNLGFDTFAEALATLRRYPDTWTDMYEVTPEEAATIKQFLQKYEQRIKETSGKLYHVELAPSEDEYLLWDKPLSEQSEKVKAALGIQYQYAPQEDGSGWQDVYARLSDGTRIDLSQATSEQAAKEFISRMEASDPEAEPIGARIYKSLEHRNLTIKNGRREGNPQDASNYLHSLGIRGIKYLDGTSRGKQGRYDYREGLPEGWGYYTENGKVGIKNAKGLVETDGHSSEEAAHRHLYGTPGNYNYVIFSDDDVTITAVEQKKLPYTPKLTPSDQAAIVEEAKKLQRDSGQLSFDFREGTTNVQKLKTKALVTASLRGRPGTRPSLLGNAINTAFVKKGVFNFVGQKITSPLDLASLAQVYRNPAFETFRYFFVKGDEIVGHTGVSSRLPSVSAVFPGEVKAGPGGAQWLADQMTAVGADGYWMLHNHPNGDVTESALDTNTTKTIAAAVEGFKGHVIINHNKYAVLDASDERGRQEYHVFDKMPDALTAASIDHPYLGRKVNSPAAVVGIGKELQKTGHILFISQGGSGIRGIMDVPAKTSAKRLAAITRKLARETGGGQVFAVIPAGHPELWEFADAAVRDGYLLDAVNVLGHSAQNSGIRPKSGNVFFGRELLGKIVAEPGEKFTSTSPDIQARRDAAHGLDKGPGLIARIKETIDRAFKETQHFPELDYSKDAQTADILRVFESSKQAATAKTVAYLRALTGDMTTTEMNNFEWRVLLDDLMEEADKQRALPFGYTPGTLAVDHARIVALTEADPKIKAAIELRQKTTAAVVKELVDAGILPESVLDSKSYFRHMVLEYANAKKWAGLGASELRNRKRGWQKSRQGSELDINTNFLEAEFEVYSQQLKELATKEALDKVDRINNIAAKLKRQAKNENFTLLVGGTENVKRIRDLEGEAAELRSGEIDNGVKQQLAVITQELDELDPTRPLKRSMAIGFSKLEKLAKRGALPEGKIKGMAEALANGEPGEKLFNYISYLAGTETEGNLPARQVLKAIAELDKLYRTALGPEYLEHRRMIDRRLIPDGYVEWQPEKGNAFHRETTLPEQIVDKAIAATWSVEDLVKSGILKESVVLGGKKRTLVIPEGVALTLDNLRFERDTAVLDTVNKKLVGAWKIWTLLSPRRVIKYNLNNMSGDLDAALAADPVILKYMKDAWQNALRRRKGNLSADDQDMLDRGVLDSGISINEIPDINQLPMFKGMADEQRQSRIWTALSKGDLSALAPNHLITRYFDKISALTNIREGLLREAAYRRALELLQQGKPVMWASNPGEINAIPDIKDRAAKLARELIGDYGNISATGERIRARYIPFWSWMEINAPRYYRILRNAAQDSGKYSTGARIAGVAGKKFIGTTAGVVEKVVLTQMLFALATVFNRLVHGDDDDELDQKQLHLIMGRDSQGRIMSVRFQGAFSDALSWFGLEDYPETIKKINDGSMGAADLARKMAMATPNKLINSALPFVKLAGETLAGKTFYPDVLRPRQIRDRGEHIARFLSMDSEYRAAAGKPSRGYADSLKGILFYTTDPREGAYNSIRSQAMKWMEKQGKEMPGGEPTAKSNALYYYKQAKRFGDSEAADKYLNKYKELGGTGTGLITSIRNASPLHATGKYSGQFVASLGPADRQKLKLAMEFFKEVYAK